jgi:hypothetical protein
MSATKRASGRTGTTVRTRQGVNIFPETSPQNSQAFGLDAGSAGGANFLAAPGAGFCWVITSLVVSFNPALGNTIRVQFTGGLSAQAFQPSSGTAPTPPPATVVTSPTAMPANSAFGYTITGSGTVSISGTAYKATIATITNPQTAQLITTPIDSDPSTDLG